MSQARSDVPMLLYHSVMMEIIAPGLYTVVHW